MGKRQIVEVGESDLNGINPGFKNSLSLSVITD